MYCNGFDVMDIHSVENMESALRITIFVSQTFHSFKLNKQNQHLKVSQVNILFNLLIHS